MKNAPPGEGRGSHSADGCANSSPASQTAGLQTARIKHASDTVLVSSKAGTEFAAHLPACARSDKPLLRNRSFSSRLDGSKVRTSDRYPRGESMMDSQIH